MSNIKNAWKYLIAEPFWWIFLCFFQPKRLRRETEKYRLVQRIQAMIRLAVPMFLTSYSLALFMDIVFLFTHTSSLIGSSQLLLVISISIISGMGIGIVGGVSVGVALGIGIGIILGITFDINGNIGISIFSSATENIGISIGVGVTLGIIASSTLGITTRLIALFALSIAAGTVVNSNGVTTGNISEGIVFAISLITGFARLPFYLVSGPSALRTYFASRQEQPNVFKYLRRSSLHWDERVYLPLPFLKRTLLLAFENDARQAVEEIVFIIAERPQQEHLARAAVREIIVRNLETRKSLEEISEAWPSITELLPLEAMPSEPDWLRLTQYLSAISIDAERYEKPIGRQEQQKVLMDVSNNLSRAEKHASTFSNKNLSIRLVHVIEIWLVVVQQEQKNLKRGLQTIGRIDNPYKPGQVLNPHDKLFVGRRDLAELLSKELNKGSQRPTFLMNGERRMGKTTTLLQLPFLLGSHYIPVFYNLQDPGIYRNIATILGTLGDKIVAEMRSKGMQVEPIGPRMLRDEYGQLQDTRAYSVFNRWLNNVEILLEQEENILLINFDEFEKLAEAGEAKDIDLRLLLDWFRNIIQFHPQIALLFSGVHTFTEMGQETGINWSGAFVNVQALKVGFLKRDEAEKLVTKPTPEYPGEEIFGLGVVDKIIHDTGCHPFLIQAICSALIDNLNVERRQRAEIADVEAAIEQVLESWDGYFGDLWIRTSEEQRACLKALLMLKSADIALLQQQSGLNEHVLRRTLKALLRRDLIAQESEMYTIVAPIFVEWVKRNA